MSLTPLSLSRLHAVLAEAAPGGRFALAFSGGLDSRFLAHAALLAGFAPQLLHVSGPHVPDQETAYAEQWAAARNLPLRRVELDPLQIPEVMNNDRQRCYYCKRALFARLYDEAGALVLCDGTNASDLGVYRPGLAALAELGVVSPLALAGLAKSDIRRLAVTSGLEDPEQKARPCLLTRLDYGQPASADFLNAIKRGEAEAARCLSNASDYRLRQVEPGLLELHLAGPEDQVPPAGPLAELAEAVSKAAGLPVRAVKFFADLSGYFDRRSADS